MKLELKCRTGVHTEMVTAVAWTPDNELYSMSDDSTIHRWDGCGDPTGKVWYPIYARSVRANDRQATGRPFHDP